MKPFIVGITGGSASGKTSFLRGLMAAFSETEICLISQDNYYRPQDQIPRDAAGVENYDLPETIDYQLFAQHIDQLRAGQTVQHPEYLFNNPNAIPRLLTFRSASIIVVEGVFVFHFAELRNQMDLKVFIDAKNSIKFKRRVKRDAEERGYDLNDVIYRWKHHVRPTYERYIKPYRAQADIVIPNNSNFQKGLQVLIAYLKAVI